MRSAKTTQKKNKRVKPTNIIKVLNAQLCEHNTKNFIPQGYIDYKAVSIERVPPPRSPCYCIMLHRMSLICAPATIT